VRVERCVAREDPLEYGTVGLAHTTEVLHCGIACLSHPCDLLRECSIVHHDPNRGSDPTLGRERRGHGRMVSDQRRHTMCLRRESTPRGDAVSICAWHTRWG